MLLLHILGPWSFPLRFSQILMSVSVTAGNRSHTTSSSTNNETSLEDISRWPVNFWFLQSSSFPLNLTEEKKTMNLSAQGAGRQNLETASAIRTETVTGSHIFKVFGYSLTKGSGIGNFIDSNVFKIDGYEWLIRFYPDGYSEKDRDFISFKLVHIIGKVGFVNDFVKVKFSFTILEQNGAPSGMSWESQIRKFPLRPTLVSEPTGPHHFIRRIEFEECLKDDAFTLRCTVTIVKDTYKREVINPYQVVVPPANLTQHLISLLESGEGADVTFVVNGNSFKAHRWMLAARSVVFKAELFGGMKEKLADTITVDDIEAPAFKAMLYFIYSDSLPDFEGKQDLELMAQHLLVAADRYALERLRLMCEDVLCKNLDVSNVATSLFLAERHNCSQLREQCLSFMSHPGVFKEVALTPGFQNLMKTGP